MEGGGSFIGDNFTHLWPASLFNNGECCGSCQSERKQIFKNNQQKKFDGQNGTGGWWWGVGGQPKIVQGRPPILHLKSG